MTFTIIGMILNFLGTLLLIFPIYKSQELIKEISTIKRGPVGFDDEDEEITNIDLKNDLETDKQMAIFGGILILIGFVFQILDVIYNVKI